MSPFNAAAAIGTALVLVIVAAWAMGRDAAALGERPLATNQIWAARLAALAAWTAANAALFGVALPNVYRARPVYAVLALLLAATATLSGVTAAALFAASR